MAGLERPTRYEGGGERSCYPLACSQFTGRLLYHDRTARAIRLAMPYFRPYETPFLGVDETGNRPRTLA
ncbi:hypothetical protein MPC4_160010 [Methylocella tundrae]|uniref:Uncharacterized protein n=1 Tax=Methylocella tundrae TaxID=227605 RepID=A0A8B6M4X5_METTU|nr:hypothetical protein MPC4_160010 [Methylocella tundrae]